MSAWIASVLKMILGVVVDRLVTFFRKALAEYQAAKQRKQELEEAKKKALEELRSAGKDPAKTPEQNAKDLEDAFDRYHDSISRQ